MSKADLYDSEKAAAFLGIDSDETFRNWLEGGRFLGAFRSEGRWLFPLASLIKMRERFNSDRTRQATMQSVKPLANDAEYNLALKDIDRCLDASKGSPEYNRLEILTNLVEEYETKHWPVAPPDSTGLGELVERLQSLVASVEVNLDETLSADE